MFKFISKSYYSISIILKGLMFLVILQDVCKELNVQDVNHLISAVKVQRQQVESAFKLEKVIFITVWNSILFFGYTNIHIEYKLKPFPKTQYNLQYYVSHNVVNLTSLQYDK